METKTICWSQIMTLIRLLVRSSYGFRTFCNWCEEKSFVIVFHFLLNSLGHNGMLCKPIFRRTFHSICVYILEIIVPALKLSTVLLIISQLDVYDFRTYANQLDDLFIDANVAEQIQPNELVDSNYQLLLNTQNQKKYASEILFERYSELLQKYKGQVHSINLFPFRIKVE